MTLERTLIFIKPDGVERGLVGEILSRFERVGLALVGLKMVWIDKDHAKKHYAEHVDKAFYKHVEAFVTGGPVVAAVLEGVSAVKLVRKMVGSTEPFGAAPGTIRGDYAHLTYEYADKVNPELGIRNVIHASGSSEEAVKEIVLWFTKEELHHYDVLHKKHTR